MFFHSLCASLVGIILQFIKIFTTPENQFDEWSAEAIEKEFSSRYRWCHWGPISANIVVIIIGLSTSIVHVSWWDITTIGGCLDLMLFLTWNYFVIRYMYLACMLGGGYIKFGWHPEYAEDWQYFRYCYKCLGFKVPRSHHCSKCKRCVLLMDHHCPWINNCVGERNQLTFIKFLFFSVVGCLHAAIILTSCLYRVIFFMMYNDNPRYSQQALPLPITSIYLFISSILAIGLAYGVIIAVGILLFVQLRSVYLNQTGIESLDKQK